MHRAIRSVPSALAGLLAVLLVVGLAPHAARAKDPPSYPEGESSQVFDGVPFRLRVPTRVAEPRPLGLVLVEPGELSDLAALFDEPYVLVAPAIPADRHSGLWSAAEVKVILRSVDHVREAFSIEGRRVHGVAVGRTSLHDIFEPIVFRKKSPFSSATYVRSTPLRISIAPEARKEMGVLAYAWEPGVHDGEGVRDFLERFRGKVRVAELRHADSPLEEPYFPYWLHVMGGGFEPGRDLSFPWREMPAARADVATALAGKGAGALLYFFSKEADAEKAHARDLQNDTFFEEEVRTLGGRATCFKGDRAACAALFSAYGLEETPAIVVVQADGTPVATLQGKFRSDALVKALRRVVPRN